MKDELEGMDESRMSEFERRVAEALVRRPAPPGLKRRILAERARRAEVDRHSYSRTWMRLAASILLVGIVAGAGFWQYRREEERRKGEEVQRQVMTALGITARALDHVETHLAEHGQDTGE
jgi:hypothetical protein